jgi:hypothetical protein
VGRTSIFIFLFLVFLCSCKTDFQTRKYTRFHSGKIAREQKTPVNIDIPCSAFAINQNSSVSPAEKYIDSVVQLCDSFVDASIEKNTLAPVSANRVEEKILPGSAPAIKETAYPVGRIDGTPNENSIRLKVKHSIMLGALGLVAAIGAIFLLYSGGSVAVFLLLLLAGALLGAGGLKNALSAKMDIDQLSRRSQLKVLNKISGFALGLNLVVLSATGLYIFFLLLQIIL